MEALPPVHALAAQLTHFGGVSTPITSAGLLLVCIALFLCIAAWLRAGLTHWARASACTPGTSTTRSMLLVQSSEPDGLCPAPITRPLHYGLAAAHFAVAAVPPRAPPTFSRRQRTVRSGAQQVPPG